VFLADGGGGSAPAPDYSGTQTLQVEPESIPGARDAFGAARDRVKAELDKLNSMEIQQWAGDPVSGEAVNKFTERTSTDIESARQVLEGYLEQLDRAHQQLDASYRYYVETEGTNAALWGKQA